MKNSKFCKLLSLMMAICLFAVISAPAAMAANVVTHWAVGKTAVSGNANNAKMPATLTQAKGGDEVYVNFQVDDSQKIKSVEFKVVDPGSSSTKTVYTERFSTFGRYAYYKYKLPNKDGTFKAFLTVTYYNGSKKDYTCPYVTVTKKASTTSTSTSSASSTTSTSSAWQMPMNNASISRNWNAIISGKGDRTNHVGIDLTSKKDSNIYAAASGTVADVGENDQNGRFVTIKHSINGTTVYSFYAHLSSYSVKAGQSVAKGAKIGVVGSSGLAANQFVHLHFSIINKLSNTKGSYWGYASSFSGNKTTYGGYTFYNPNYVISNNKLP